MYNLMIDRQYVFVCTCRFLEELEKLNSHEKLFLEMESLKSVLLKHNPPVVFCHNDLLCKNIVYNKDKGE